MPSNSEESSDNLDDEVQLTTPEVKSTSPDAKKSTLDIMSGGWGIGWRFQGGHMTNRKVSGKTVCK